MFSNLALFLVQIVHWCNKKRREMFLFLKIVIKYTKAIIPSRKEDELFMSHYDAKCA